MGLVDQLRKHAADRAGRDAVVTVERSFGYGELLQRVEAAASALAAAGIAPGTLVGLTIGEEVDNLVASLALVAIGARQVTLATFDPLEARARLARRIGLTYIVATSPQYALEGTALVLWDPDASPAGSGFGGEEGSIFLRTSGTTGDMNVTEFHADQIHAQAETHSGYGEERLLRPAVIEHNNSRRHRLYSVMTGGVTVFREGIAGDFLKFTRDYGVTAMDIAGMHAATLAGTMTGRPLDGIRICVAGGPTRIEMRRALENNVSRNIYIRYGATEAGGIALAGPGQHDERESSGSLLPGAVIEIVNDEGEVQPQGEVGKIRLKTAGMAHGYFDNPEATARRFRDGWFWPGDMGYLTPDGQIVVKGRQDDMMILNGVNIFPVEIERVLETHPAVSVAAALPLASPVHGQIPVAAVELKPGAEVTPRDLLLYAQERLAVRGPRRVIVLDKLPRTPQGKILRRVIAESFQPPKKSS